MSKNKNIGNDNEVICYKCGGTSDIEDLVCDKCGALLNKDNLLNEDDISQD